MKGGDYSNQVFKQLQEVMKKCDDLSHEVKIIERKQKRNLKNNWKSKKNILHKKLKI